MRDWLSALSRDPGLPDRWQRVSATAYRLRHGNESIGIEIKRPPSTRRASVRAHGQGMVLCLPPRASEQTTHQYLLEFEPWIVEQWTRLLAHTVPLLVPFETASLPLFGEPLDVAWSSAAPVSIHTTDKVIHIAAPDAIPASPLGDRLKQFYEAQSRNRLAPLLQTLAPGLPKLPVRIRFARVRSIWGSMNTKGVLTLERSLAIAPGHVFDYLLVHELCHLLEMNHSRRFWQHVAERAPNYHHSESYLKAHGARVRMDFDRLTDPARFQ